MGSEILGRQSGTGPTRGGGGRGDNDLGAHELERGGHPNDIKKWKAHRSRMWTACFRLEKPLKFRWRPPFFFWRSLDIARKNRWYLEDLFFFEITSFFGPNSSIFSVYFGLYKATIPSHLSWPRAHVQLSAPLVRDLGVWRLKWMIEPNCGE